HERPFSVKLTGRQRLICVTGREVFRPAEGAGVVSLSGRWKKCLESCLCEVLVRSQGCADFQFLHDDKACAVGKRIAVIRMLPEVLLGSRKPVAAEQLKIYGF